MHGQVERSRLPRAIWVAVHGVQVAVSLWILLGGGYAVLGRWLGMTWTAGDPARRIVLAGFAVVLWVRMALTGLVLLERRFGWSEAIPVMLATAVYQWGFALLGVGAHGSLDALDWIGIAAYLVGSYFNTGSELQRKAFKSKPEHAGRLFTGGLFALSRHPNYFGDSLWGVGWALVTHRWWASIIVAVEVGGFVGSQIPMLDKYLAEHYGDAYRAWARKTKRFIPFVY